MKKFYVMILSRDGYITLRLYNVTFQDWRDILYDFTGDRDLNTAPLLEYFKPLEDYLDDVIEKNNLFVGWKSWEPPSKHFVDPSGSSAASTIGHLALIAIIPLIFVQKN